VAELDFVRRAAVLQSLLFCFVLLVCFFSCGKVCGDDGGCYLSGELLKDQFGLFLVEWRWERRGGRKGRRSVCLRWRWSPFCRTRRTDLWQGQWRRGTWTSIGILPIPSPSWFRYRPRPVLLLLKLLRLLLSASVFFALVSGVRFVFVLFGEGNYSVSLFAFLFNVEDRTPKYPQPFSLCVLRPEISLLLFSRSEFVVVGISQFQIQLFSCCFSSTLQFCCCTGALGSLFSFCRFFFWHS
jgi:hypothetical protein